VVAYLVIKIRDDSALTMPVRGIVAASLVGGISSALLVSTTDYRSIFAGPLVAGGLGALYVRVSRPRVGQRAVNASAAWIVVGSFAIMIGVIVISAILYAIFG
jgi:hypothetical protein